MCINISKSIGVISDEIIARQDTKPTKRHVKLKLPNNPGLNLAFQKHLLASIQIKRKLLINNPQKDLIINILPQLNNVSSLNLSQLVYSPHD